MRRYIFLIAALAMVLSACGSSTVSTTFDSVGDTGGGNEVVSAETTVQVEAVDDTSTIVDATSAPEPATSAEPTDFDGPAAEDFSVELNRSGTFTLSSEARPVYLIFWAEW